jgi:hypothetical protein
MMFESPNFETLMKVRLPIGQITSAVLLTTGIGLLRLKPWARKVSIGYAIYAILFVLINVPINFFLLYWPMLEHGRQLQGPQGVVMIFAAILGTVGGVLGWVYPVLLCIFMTRPKFVAAFQSPPPLPASLP